MLDPTDYVRLKHIQKNVRSELPFLLLSLLIFFVTVTLVIVSPLMWVRFLGCAMGVLVWLNAARTIIEVLTNIKLIQELEMLIKRSSLLMLEGIEEYMKEKRNA